MDWYRWGCAKTKKSCPYSSWSLSTCPSRAKGEGSIYLIHLLVWHLSSLWIICWSDNLLMTTKWVDTGDGCVVVALKLLPLFFTGRRKYQGLIFIFTGLFSRVFVWWHNGASSNSCVHSCVRIGTGIGWRFTRVLVCCVWKSSGVLLCVVEESWMVSVFWILLFLYHLPCWLHVDCLTAS